MIAAQRIPAKPTVFILGILPPEFSERIVESGLNLKVWEHPPTPSASIAAELDAATAFLGPPLYTLVDVDHFPAFEILPKSLFPGKTIAFGSGREHQRLKDLGYHGFVEKRLFLGEFLLALQSYADGGVWWSEPSGVSLPQVVLLTVNEKQILDGWANDTESAVTMRELDLSKMNFRKTELKLMGKLGVKHETAAVLVAVRLGLLLP